MTDGRMAGDPADKRTFEDVLRDRGSLVYPVRGDSMLPLLRQDRDLAVIRRPDREPRRLDAVLYRRASGQVVLHRIVGVRRDGFVLCGDNRWRREYGVQRLQIMGILTAVVRDGLVVGGGSGAGDGRAAEVPVTALRWRIYVGLICGLFPLRAAVLMARGALRRIRRFFRARKGRPGQCGE